MTADEARTHIRYSSWASKRLLDAAMKLDPEQFNRDLGVPNKSVRGTLEHVYWADGIWIERVGGPPLQKGAIEAEWPQTQQYWQKFVDGLTDADLTRTISYKDTKGNPHETPLWQIVMHVVNHATLHRGQAMAMFRQLGVAPPPTDLIFYYREQQAARA